MDSKIGWIGTGVMGSSMCMHLLKHGYNTFVYNRTKEKASELLKEGAIWCESPAEVAKNADVIFTIVSYPQDVEETILGENGVLANCSENKIIVDMTTSEPALAQKIGKLCADKKVGCLDAPVSGGDLGAKNGTLAIMVGGDQKSFDQVSPLFDIMGQNIKYMGKYGSGQHTKMCNQILVSGAMISTVEALMYAAKAGLDQNQMIDVVGTGAAGSWSFSSLGKRIVEKDYDPGFYIKHFVKDMGIALAESKKMNLALPGLALVNQFYISAMASGFENLGTQALYKILADMNKIDN